MKTLLIGVNSKFIHTNLAVRYLKKYLCYNNFESKILEFNINQNIDNIMACIIKEKPEIIAFSCYIWNIEYIKKISYILKIAYPNIKIIWGGPEVSYEVEKCMIKNEYVDFMVFGEGEETLKELISFIKEDDFSNVDGIAWRNKDKVTINKNRELINDLSKIKSLYEEEINLENKMIYFESSRGCPYRCSFCISSINKKVRYFPLEDVKSQLKNLLTKNIKQIKFIDRTFNSDINRAIEIMKFIINNNEKNIKVHFEINADKLNDDFLNFICKAPIDMFQFEIGIQSFNEKTLNEINRKANIDKLKNTIKKIISYKNIHVHLDLIAGLPYEDYNSFINSFNEVYKLKAEKVQLGFLKVLKGTKIYTDRKEHGIESFYYAPYEVIKTKYITYEEIIRLKKVEELVEKYYNEKYFSNSIEYLTEFIFDSPYNFYNEFSKYWDNNELFSVSHKRKRLYEILYKFVKTKINNLDELIFKLKYDYIYNNPKEEVLKIFDKSSEENYKKLKHDIFKN